MGKLLKGLLMLGGLVVVVAGVLYTISAVSEYKTFHDDFDLDDFDSIEDPDIAKEFEEEDFAKEAVSTTV